MQNYNTKFKILLITLEYPPQNGGVASYYAGLADELQRQGYEITVISQNLLFKWFWPRWVRVYFTLRTAIKKENPDIIFVGHLLPLGTVAWLLGKKAPYIIFTHGMDVLMAQKSWRKKWLTKKILQKARLIIANSEFTKNQILACGSHFITKTIVVYPCPSISFNISQESIELLRRKFGLSGKKVLLTLGRIVERKGHEVVIRAMPEILRHIPNTIYVIAGEGPNLNKLAHLVEKLQLQSYIRFVGKIPDEERSIYYALCDIFIMPTRQIGPDVEGFGLVFLEAALFEKSSIGGKSGGVSEAIIDGQTGLLCDPEDPRALARLTVQILRQEDLPHKFGQNAQKRVLSEFVWRKQIVSLIEFLQSIPKK